MLLQIYVTSQKQKTAISPNGENSGKQHKKAYIYFVRLSAILSLYSEEGQYDQIKVGLLAHASLYSKNLPIYYGAFFSVRQWHCLISSALTVAETASAFNRIPY